MIDDEKYCNWRGNWRSFCGDRLTPYLWSRASRIMPSVQLLPLSHERDDRPTPAQLRVNVADIAHNWAGVGSSCPAGCGPHHQRGHKEGEEQEKCPRRVCQIANCLSGFISDPRTFNPFTNTTSDREFQLVPWPYFYLGGLYWCIMLHFEMKLNWSRRPLALHAVFELFHLLLPAEKILTCYMWVFRSQNIFFNLLDKWEINTLQWFLVEDIYPSFLSLQQSCIWN